MGSQEDASMRTALRSAEETGIDYEVFDAGQLAVRYPQFKMYDGDLAILDVRGGFIRPELTVAAAARLAQQRGAKLFTNSLVLDVRGTPPGQSSGPTAASSISTGQLSVPADGRQNSCRSLPGSLKHEGQYPPGTSGKILDTCPGSSPSSEPNPRTATAFPPPTTRR